MTIVKSPANQDTIRVTLLPSKDSVRNFSCGEREIDHWVSRQAVKWTSQNRTKVFVACNAGNELAVGFYSLSFSSEEASKLEAANDRDIWHDGVPLIYIGYLGVRRELQGNGFGTFLLLDALKRAHHVSQHVAFYGVGLRSLNDKTTELYSKFGFGIAKDEDRHPLMILPIWTLNDLFN